MNRTTLFIFVVLITYCGVTQAEKPATIATNDIVATYSFDPTTMSFDEQAKRAPELGKLWSRFHKSPESYRVAMRELLGKDGQSEMLYCDGGMLFLQEARLESDKKLGLKSIMKCSLVEIQHTPYFYTMHREAVAGMDTMELQFRILTKPKYQVFIPHHALTLGQDYAFVYPLLVQDERKYVEQIIDKTKVEKDETALKTLLLALYYAATARSEYTIRSIGNNKQTPPEVQKRAKEMTEQIGEMRKNDPTKIHDWLKRNMVEISPSATEPDLRAARRKRMQAISDEALMELDMYTLLIYQVRK
ncbi:MAG: hypothetical protein OEZ58_08810 [Gammaproteobacteria bacterium]|nr:hypothetical protein [Gammaproteobacteria bacterium]MDH5729077.1 hypothetical protein [Gammaproteobacteria bacterium]